MPLVSIIIPNFNNSQWLPTCIESCLRQEGNFKLEIIVIDDHSTDDSWRILKDFQKAHPDEIFIYKNREKGGNQARNFGFTKATGDYIQWLDSDDFLLSGKLNAQTYFLEKNSEIDIVYSDWQMDIYKDGEKVEGVKKVLKSFDSFLKVLIEDLWLPNNSYLVRSSFANKLHELNAWNPETKVAQDREYFTMAAIYGAKFEYTSGLFSVYNRWSEKSVSAINFKRRLKLNQALESKFMNLIIEQKWIDQKIKSELVAVIKTDGLKACYYHPKLKILRPISFFEIKWRLIHYKMRFVIPFIWLYQMILYYFRIISKP